MRLLFIQKSTGRGGAKNSLLETLTALRADGAWHPQVLAGEEGPFLERCAALGVPSRIAPLPEWRKLMERLKFRRAMKHAAAHYQNQSINWVISNEMWWGPHAARIARHLGCRSAVILRDGIATVRKSLQYRLQENDLILPVSTTIAKALQAHPAFQDRTEVLFNSVCLPDAGATSEQIAPKLAEFQPVSRWLLVVGRVCARKRQTDAIQILRMMLANGESDLGLILAGDVDPDYEAELSEATADPEVAGRVLCLGNVDDLRTLLHHAHAVLLTSTREGLPRSLVESLLVPLPTFSYPCEGVEDIFGIHLKSFTSETSTPHSLYQVIRRAWSRPEETADAVRAVAANVERRFSRQAHFERLKSLLGE